MATLRIIRKRVKSVASTRKITKAMKMVAAARLRRAQEALTQASPYAKKVEELFSDLFRSVPASAHPLLGTREVKKRLLVIFASDRGLCGAFNTNIFRKGEQELRLPGIETTLMPLGRKASSYFARRNATFWKSGADYWKEFSYTKVSALAQELVQAYLDGTFDRVDLLYNHFHSMISQRPTVLTLAPIQRAEESEMPSTNYIFEPSRQSIVVQLVPKSVEIKLYMASLQSLTSEHGARMTAMDAATRNAGDMIDRLTLQMNRVRQAAITKELVEIISGAEALK